MSAPALDWRELKSRYGLDASARKRLKEIHAQWWRYAHNGCDCWSCTRATERVERDVLAVFRRDVDRVHFKLTRLLD